MKANKHTRRERVDEIIEMLRLQNCRDLKIGTPGLVKGISGGEARRLTFACELLSNPSLLFADEPTSGLDSFMAASVVQILKNLANSGRTLIHQPTAELFFQFDKIIFLSMGKTAFMGTPHESVKVILKFKKLFKGARQKVLARPKLRIQKNISECGICEKVQYSSKAHTEMFQSCGDPHLPIILNRKSNCSDTQL